MRRSFLRSIDASLNMVYSYGAGVMSKGIHWRIKDISPTVSIHVDIIFVFSWTRRYAASRSVFPIRMRFEGHLMCIASIMWIILRRHNL